MISVSEKPACSSTFTVRWVHSASHITSSKISSRIYTVSYTHLDVYKRQAAAWVKKTLNDHRRVIFNGNGYSEAWEAEAARRGLPNRKCTPDAVSYTHLDVYKRQFQ